MKKCGVKTHTKLGSELTIGDSFSYGNSHTVWTIESFMPNPPFLGAIPAAAYSWQARVAAPPS